jgi:hypothetical protein
MVAGNIAIVSGAPRNCYGGFGPDQEDAGYGVDSYHWCNGLPSPPGSGSRLPFTHTVALSTEYRPAFADHKLAFSLEVFNLLNEQQKLQSSPYYGVSSAPDPEYRRALQYQTPRSVRFGVAYDF